MALLNAVVRAYDRHHGVVVCHPSPGRTPESGGGSRSVNRQTPRVGASEGEEEDQCRGARYLLAHPAAPADDGAGYLEPVPASILLGVKRAEALRTIKQTCPMAGRPRWSCHEVRSWGTSRLPCYLVSFLTPCSLPSRRPEWATGPYRVSWPLPAALQTTWCWSPGRRRTCPAFSRWWPTSAHGPG
jgi:hypothetical protein